MRIIGKWALVTGSSRGIGQQIALELARRGCNLFIHGRTKNHCQKTLELIAPYGINIHIVSGELSSPKETEKLVAAIHKEIPGLDILYNNAGIQNDWHEVPQFPLEDWEKIFHINLFSPIQLVDAFLPYMLQQKQGCIINTGSDIQKIPQMLPYACTKSALATFARDLAPSLENTGVTIHTLDPNWLRTDLGGPEGTYPVESVIPGALAPLLRPEELINGEIYHAHAFGIL